MGISRKHGRANKFEDTAAGEMACKQNHANAVLVVKATVGGGSRFAQKVDALSNFWHLTVLLTFIKKKKRFISK